MLVTKDEDFVHRSVRRGMPPKVLWLNVGNAGSAAIVELLLPAADEFDAFVAPPELGYLALGRRESGR